MSDESIETKLSKIFGGLDPSNSAVKFHQKFWGDFEDEYQTLTDHIDHALEGYRRENNYFNDHGIGHSYRIIDNMGAIDEEIDESLESAEAFILACCAWLHDIGMAIERKIPADDLHEKDTQKDWFDDIGTTSSEPQTIEAKGEVEKGELIREWHHILSWHFIRTYWEDLGLPNNHVADEIAEISRVHRRAVPIDFSKDHFDVRINSERYSISRSSIAAIFQFADALDTDSRRAQQDERRYILNLPPESQKHWDACELINTFTLDLGKNLLTFRAHHRDEETRNLLKWKMKEIYEEYDSISDILSEKPYQLALRDIKCHSYHGDNSSIEIEISGRDQFLDKTRERSQTVTEEQSENFKDYKNSFWIDIKNENGDAEVKRQIKMEFRDQDISKRTHLVRSFDHGMDWNWSKDIRAQDELGNKLSVKPKFDRNTYKEFDVIFPENIDKSEFYTYEYEYYWEEYFPTEEEVFGTEARSINQEFTVDFPQSFEIVDIRCKERSADGFDEFHKAFESNGENTYTAAIEKANIQSELRIEWEVKK